MIAPGAVARGEISELEARAIAARHGGLREYAWAVHNLEIEPYQEAWYEALETEDRVVIVCPPDTYKTTTVRLWLEQAIGRDPESSNLWLMGSSTQAETSMIPLTETIQLNPVYHAAFPQVRPNKHAVWNKSVIFVERRRVSKDPTLMATGILGAYQGFHFKRIIIDDPTDQDDVRSPITMAAQREKVRGVISDRLTDDGRIVVILTRWGETDLVPTFREMGYRIIAMPVEADYPWGKTISPRRFPPEKLARLRQEKGDKLYQLTYMCDTSAMSGALIKREHLRYWTPDMIPRQLMPVFVGVDPAASTRTQADRSAIATVGYDVRTRRMFLLDLWQGRVEVPDFRQLLIRHVHQTAGVVAVGIETVAYQLGLIQDLKREAQLPIREIPYRTRRQVQECKLGIDKDKASRALYLDALFTSGRLYLPKGLPTVDGVSLEAELLTYGTETNNHHDDGPDALAFACALADAAIPQAEEVRVIAR